MLGSPRFRQVTNRLPIKGDLEEDQGILRHGDQGERNRALSLKGDNAVSIAESMPLAIIGGCWGLYDVMICYVMLFAYRMRIAHALPLSLVDMYTHGNMWVAYCDGHRLCVYTPEGRPLHNTPYLLIPRAGAEASQLWLHMVLVLLWHPSLAPSGVAGDGHVNQP